MTEPVRLDRFRLEKRWYDFWIRSPGVSREEILRVRTRLWKHYNEELRAYHNLEHIEFCLEQFDRYRLLAQNPTVVEAAIWFHDVIYDPKRKDNENKSAMLAGQEMIRLGASADFRTAVRQAIRATTHSFVIKEKDVDDRLVCDIDLLGLAQGWETFKADGENIRKEYAWVAWNDYVEARCKILQSFLNCEHIYYHAAIRHSHGAARTNLSRAIEELQKAG